MKFYLKSTNLVNMKMEINLSHFSIWEAFHFSELAASIWRKSLMTSFSPKKQKKTIFHKKIEVTLLIFVDVHKDDTNLGKHLEREIKTIKLDLEIHHAWQDMGVHYGERISQLARAWSAIERDLTSKGDVF